jgi:hypothetical protein
MEYYKLILPEHLNHHGKLFGGNTLKWIDEFAYITASQEFPATLSSLLRWITSFSERPFVWERSCALLSP